MENFIAIMCVVFICILATFLYRYIKKPSEKKPQLTTPPTPPILPPEQPKPNNLDPDILKKIRGENQTVDPLDDEVDQSLQRIAIAENLQEAAEKLEEASTKNFTALGNLLTALGRRKTVIKKEVEIAEKKQQLIESQLRAGIPPQIVFGIGQ